MELLNGRGSKLRTSGDVWLFGVMTWEIFSPNKYYDISIANVVAPGVKGTEQIVIAVMKFYKKGNHLPKPKHMRDDLYKIVKKCLKVHECDRPTFVDICSDMSKLLDA